MKDLRITIILSVVLISNWSIAQTQPQPLPPPTVTLESAHVPLFTQNPMTGIYNQAPENVQNTLRSYAARGFTLVSTSTYDMNPNRFMYMIFQKIDPPTNQQIETLLSQNMKEMEKRIREELVKEINNLPGQLDTNKDFLEALNKQVKSEMESKYILIEKDQGVNTLNDYKQKLLNEFTREFDVRYKKK